ncbi:MAG TPA: hypothetical protein VH084_28280 [Mycobacterium sp.]|nr:hypothetical protein [Mycobacterium sp.]
MTAEDNRVTVTLTHEVRTDLEALKATTNLSQTDLVNRAIRLLRFVIDEQSTGSDIFVQAPDLSLTKIKFI